MVGKSVVPLPLMKNVCFTAACFDRQSLKRTDDSWITQQLNDENSLFLLLWNYRFLFSDTSELSFLKKTAAEEFSKIPIEWKFLGELSKTEDGSSPQTIFGAEITAITDKAEQANWQSLRSTGLHLPAEQANLLAYAQGLLNWHSSHQFCNYCGSGLIQTQAGHALKCSHVDCAKELFPRTDPAIIVLVYHQDACLLGRQATWPEKMYSCLAGFIETGEDIDSAVHREVFEESGLELSKINYRGSQPWPFPQSLMLGFHAEATNKELTFHDGEIQDAQWFSRHQLIEALERDELRLPSPVSISYHLIEDWFNCDNEIPLRQFLKK